MSDSAPSKIIPNSFQKPNWIADVVMRYLPGEHYKCLDVVVRKTLGWMKMKDRIAQSQIVEMTGMSEDTVGKCMKELCAFGLVIKTDGNNASNQGNEYALQMDDTNINIGGLAKWDEARREKNIKRTAKARSHLRAKQTVQEPKSRGGGVPQGSPVPQGGGGGVPQGTQKPLSKTNVVVVVNAGDIFKKYENEFGALTPAVRDFINDAIDTYEMDWIPEAMDIAVKANVRTWNYVEGILKKCKAKGMRPSLNKQEKGKTYGNNGTSNSKGAKPSRPAPKRNTEHTAGDHAAAELVKAKQRQTAVP